MSSPMADSLFAYDAAQTPAPPSDAPGMAQGLPFSSMPDFDILDWHPAYQSCQRYFIDHSQYEPGTQALCALINIRLPIQWLKNPVTSSRLNPASGPASSAASPDKDWPRSSAMPPFKDRNGVDMLTFVSLIPYIRRLVVTGFDADAILHGLFGSAWLAGTGPLRECERRNYLFAAKAGGWGNCKEQYDMNEEETVPFMQPLRNATREELASADRTWSSWLKLEDWMVGPRAPGQPDTGRGGTVQPEQDGQGR